MSFGSFGDGLKRFKLNSDWTAPVEPEEWYTIARHADANHAAGSDAGAKSTYHLAVGRSTSITGPYLDKSGRDMNQGGGSVIMKGDKTWPGLGHNSAYPLGKNYLVTHLRGRR